MNLNLLKKDPTIVTIIGSMRYYEQMLQQATIMSYHGFIVLHQFKDTRDRIPPDDMETYESLIRKKIDAADIVMVMNINNYIGESTEQEIEYALNRGKIVEYFSDDTIDFTSVPSAFYDNIISGISEYPAVTLIGSGRFRGQFDRLDKLLTVWGFIVYTPGIFKFNTYEIDDFTDQQHSLLDRLHDAKIKKSNAILVVDGANGNESYIGEDTRRELEVASALNRELYYTTRNGVNKLIMNFRGGCLINETL